MKDPFSLSRIASVDSKDVRSTYEKWPVLAREGFHVEVEVAESIPKRAFFLGMGGSASGGDIISGWMSAKPGFDLDVFKGEIPAIDMSGALAVACSASGETEETIEMMRDAFKRHASVVAISGGGTLLKESERLGIPHIMMPKVVAPRYMLPFMVFSTLSILNKGMGLNCDAEADEAFFAMEREKSEVRTSSPLGENGAKAVAVELLEKTPAIYATRITKGVGMRFKNVLNENAKKHARFDGIPDTFHNDIEAWEDPRTDFLPLFLRHALESARDRAKTDSMIKILEKAGKSPLQVSGRGSSSLAQLMTLAYRLDMASYYASVGLGRDPFPTKLIDILKKG
jgi:glucose/mannose-6-phosphate isomerase